MSAFEPHLVAAVILERDPRPRRIEPERIHAALAHGRIEAEQRPVAARGCARRLLHPEPHVDPVRDALRIGEDQTTARCSASASRMAMSVCSLLAPIAICAT